MSAAENTGQIPRTKEQLLNELAEAHARIAELEIAEGKRRQMAEEAQRRAAQAALIYEVGRRVSGELELETLLSQVVTAICEAFDYYGVMLMLIDKDEQYLSMQAVAGAYADISSRDLQLAVGQGLIGRVLAGQQALGQGAVGNQPDIQLLAGVHEPVALGTAPQQAVLYLVRG